MGPVLDDAAVGLVRAVADVAASTDVRDAATTLTDAVAATLGAHTSSLAIVQPDRSVRLVAVRSGQRIELDRFEHIDLSLPMPTTEAIRLRETVVAHGRDALIRRWPAVPTEYLGDEASVVVAPLLAPGRCLGALAMVLPSDEPPAEWQVRSLEALAEATAQAIERIEANGAAADARAKLEFVAAASETLAASLDYESTLRAVADLAVPRLADWCSIDLLDDGRLRRVAVSHVDPEKVRFAWELWERYPTDPEAPTGAGAVLRTGVTELVEAVDDEVLDAAGLEPELRAIVRELQLTSGITVALQARGRTLGVITLVYAESGRAYGADDVRFAEDVARRAALAIDNAELFTETLQAALQLQQAVLPSTFADSARWRVAVHYRPAGRSEVGGDFFDAVTLPDGRLVVAVGDVMGRGVAAAAAMAQVRAAMRAYVADDPDPARVITRLQAMFGLLEMGQLVTLVYGLVDPAAGTAQWISAGHLPPLVVTAGGLVRRIDVTAAPPLGAGDFDRVATDVVHQPGDLVVLYSDGLVERRGEDIDDGLQRLEEVAGRLSGHLSDASLHDLADELRGDGRDDDVTVLAFEQLAVERLAS